MSARAGFLAAILESPADDAPRLAYADWLRERDDPFDQAHGRFLAAGLALHHMPEPVAGNEGPYFEALAAQNDTALQVVGVQARHLLGWAPGAIAWDNATGAPGRVTAAVLPESRPDESPTARRARRRDPAPRPALTWERGCLAAVWLPLATWAGWCVRLVHLCPVQCVRFHEVPGLVVRIERTGGGGWCCLGELELPEIKRGGTVVRPRVRAAYSCPAAATPAHTREVLVRSAWEWTDLVLRRLRLTAGDFWPGPAEWDGPHPADALRAREGLGLD
ncbi:MAG TPA: TIGR02996 domain-containing protein [Gemmata sp.]